MVCTNRGLKAMRDAIDCEIFQLTTLQRMSGRCAGAECIDGELYVLGRERRALSIALVNREIEASRSVVSFAKWVSGNAALDNVRIRRLAGGRAAQHSASNGR